MKKVLLVLLCFVLLAVPALATSSAQMYISSDASTCYRGDTVTFTVRLSQVDACKAGGLELSYDSAVFQWVSGSCTASGAFMKDFSNGSGAFSFSEGTSVSGGVFRFTLKIREDAPFGTATVSGSASIRDVNGSIPCSVQGASVSVTCRHSFDSCAKTDATKHTYTCRHCGQTKEEAHSYSSRVDKPATCKEPGSETLTCSACKDSKTQVIPQSSTHSYGSWSKVSDSSHKRSCKLCGKEETAAHSWDSGKITKAATCTDTGTRVRTCTGCKDSKTETVPKSTQHSFSQWEATADGTHTRKCTACGKSESAAHTWGSWSHDEINHYQLCADCGQRSEQAAHIPGTAATETTDQICTVCARVLTPSTAHTHVFDQQWQQDESFHWHSCTQCEEKQGLSMHSYSNDCDETCDVCLAPREAPHAPAGDYSTDGTSHWFHCIQCGDQLQLQSHQPGEPASLRNAQVCTICNLELVPQLTHDDHNYSSTHTHICECGQEYTSNAQCAICAEAQENFPWWLVVIAETVVLGGVILLLLLKRPHISKFER